MSRRMGFIYRVWKTTERFSLEERHDWIFIPEGSLWLLCGDESEQIRLEVGSLLQEAKQEGSWVWVKAEAVGVERSGWI